MKIAIVTNDGEYVSQHFGRSKYYKIYTIEDNEILNIELRERATGHFGAHAHHGAHHNHSPSSHNQAAHGFDAEAQSKHAMMAREIADCDVLIAGGMGLGAYQSFTSAGLQVILTDLTWIEEVVTAFMENKLKNLAAERTH